mmetsp:Transcript_19433/g.35227  ORF Transcript_19433/g.35227 Transcript_19433/m.35227 type:complete len:98 (-) Transcript_19433:123-416(-)
MAEPAETFDLAETDPSRSLGLGPPAGGGEAAKVCLPFVGSGVGNWGTELGGTVPVSEAPGWAPSMSPVTPTWSTALAVLTQQQNQRSNMRSIGVRRS